MNKRIKHIMAASVLMIGMLLSGGLAATSASLAGASAQSEITNGIKQVNDGNSTDLTPFIQNVVNLLLFIIGVISVIMIIFGGFRFVTSGGSAETVKTAKNTILYAVVGLVVAILAFAIVNFVVTNLN